MEGNGGWNAKNLEQLQELHKNKSCLGRFTLNCPLIGNLTMDLSPVTPYIKWIIGRNNEEPVAEAEFRVSGMIQPPPVGEPIRVSYNKRARSFIVYPPVLEEEEPESGQDPDLILHV